MIGRVVSAICLAFGVVLAVYIAPRLTPVETALAFGFIAGSACTSIAFALFIVLIVVPIRSARAAERRH